ncbi:MAG TPA: amidohydrolase family protein, partial [Candidatus Acidoferrales bacterium]|nr:amidohydrolase family protein [Candidatus Acidoferrales bacterium]
IPHLGSFADDWRAQLAMIDHLVRHANVYMDTSGIRRFDLLQDAVRRAGAGKVLFGTDGPWLHPAVELVKVRVLGLPQHEEQMILSGNFLRLTAGVRPRPKAYAVTAVAAAWSRGELRDPWSGAQFPSS